MAAIFALKEATLQQFSTNWEGLITTLLVVGAAVDVTIATAMCYFLKQQREMALSRFVFLFSIISPCLSRCNAAFNAELRELSITSLRGLYVSLAADNH
jgi:hypothetical protein